MNDLTKKPWESAAEQAPRAIYYPHGMIGPEERRAYYWLARNHLSGSGHIVDAGSFIGASSFCFAAGAAEAGHSSFKGRPIIQAYDYFSAIDDYVAEAITRDFRAINQGDSYLDIFEYQTGKYSSLIQSHSGDFLTHKWLGSPIELLFIDIAKTNDLNSHLVGEMFPSLVPGKSIVIHQDYFHCWHPYIHFTMEFFSEEFELVDEYVPYQSRIWRLSAPLPKEKIDRIRSNDLSESERMTLLNRLVMKSSPLSRPMLEVVRLWQRCLDKDYDAAQVDIKRLRYDYDSDKCNDLWAIQCREIEAYVLRMIAGDTVA